MSGLSTDDAIKEKREADLSQQVFCDAEPFRIERLSADGLASSTIPVRRIALIAFLAMQVASAPKPAPAATSHSSQLQ